MERAITILDSIFKELKRHISAFPRRVSPGCWKTLPALSDKEGAGRPGARCARRPRVQWVVAERTRVGQVTPESPGTPRAMVYGLYRALPGERLFCHRRRRNCFRKT